MRAGGAIITGGFFNTESSAITKGLCAVVSVVCFSVTVFEFFLVAGFGNSSGGLRSCCITVSGFIAGTFCRGKLSGGGGVVFSFLNKINRAIMIASIPALIIHTVGR